MPTGKRGAGGYTLLGLLFFIAGLGVGLAALGTHWSAQARKEKEIELLFIGEEYRRALDGYYRAGPGGFQRHPRRLEDLLEDNRFPYVVRHLRRIYRDPMTGESEWGLERDALGDITGIYSKSGQAPRKTSGFPQHQAHFIGAQHYSDWIFRATPEPSPQKDGNKPVSRGDPR